MNLLKADSRNVLLDALKGIAMFLVVLTHVFQRTIPNYVTAHVFPAQILYLLCVPIFFFLSGISYSRKKELTPLGFIIDIIKKALCYFWPFLFFILLRISLFQQWPSVEKAFDELMEYPVSGLWVLWVLCFIIPLLDIGLLISKLCPKYKKCFVTVVFTIGITIMVILRTKNIIHNDHFIGYNYFIVFSPIFLLGYIVGDKYFNMKKPIISLIVFIISITGLIVLCYYKRKFMGTEFYDDLWYNYLASLLSMGVYLGIIEVCKKIKTVTNIISISGRYTLEMYFLHLVLLKEFSRLFYDSWIITVLIIIGLLLLCYANTAIVIVITYYVPFLHFLLFGKHFSKYKWEDKIWGKINLISHLETNVKR